MTAFSIRQVRVHPLQLSVFGLEFTESLHVRHGAAAVLASPLEERRLARTRVRSLCSTLISRNGFGILRRTDIHPFRVIAS